MTSWPPINGFQAAPRELRDATPDIRKSLYVCCLTSMRRGLAVETEALDPLALEEIGNASRQSLREPWCIGQQERIRSASALMIDAPAREEAGVQGEPLVLRAGPRSALARRLNNASFGADGSRQRNLRRSRSPHSRGRALRHRSIGLDPIRSSGLASCGEAVRFVAGKGRADGRNPNRYFVQLYETLADVLAAEERGYLASRAANTLRR